MGCCLWTDQSGTPQIGLLLAQARFEYTPLLWLLLRLSEVDSHGHWFQETCQSMPVVPSIPSDIDWCFITCIANRYRIGIVLHQILNHGQVGLSHHHGLVQNGLECVIHTANGVGIVLMQLLNHGQVTTVRHGNVQWSLTCRL